MNNLYILSLFFLFFSYLYGTVTQTGTNTEYNISTANTGTVSSTITVPADAELIIVGISGYHTVSNYFSGGSMTFTKSGVDTAMTVAITGANGGDNSTSAYMSAMFYMVLPDTGTNKSLKWDWSGTASATNAPIISTTFWKGINTSTTIRGSSGGQNSGLPYTTSTVTAQSGDLIIAWIGGYVSVEGTISTWSNLTELAEITIYGSGDGAWATGTPTGNTTVAASTGFNFSDGGIVAISIIPSSGSRRRNSLIALSEIQRRR